MALRITTQTQEIIMSNPYQIRTDVLAMAKNMLDKQYDTQMEIAKTMFEANKENMELATEAWNKYIPKMYTMEEVMEKANEMYSFVSEKK
jgi:CRISPR/Cas system-associated endonuclease Cas3-HD